MSQEDLHLEEEDNESTPTLGSESEESDDLFEDEEDSKESKSSKDDQIKALEAKLERLEKGVSKFFSENGRKKDQPSERKEAPKSSDSSEDLKALFLTTTPQAGEVMEDLETVAKAKGISILQAWNGEKWLQEKARMVSEQKAEEEKSKQKISKPSADVDFPSDITKVKPEDVHKLPASKRMEWIASQAAKERLNGD